MARIPRLRPVLSAQDVPVQHKVPELIRVPAKPALVGHVLSDVIFRLPTHHVGGRTVICSEDDECNFCDAAELRFYGLIALWNRNSSHGVWVQLPAQAATSLLTELADSQLTLHGCVVRVGRERPVINAPVVISIDRYAQALGRLPKPWTPEETIERVFNSPKSAPILPIKLVG